MILSLGACRVYGEPTRIRNVRDLRRERNRPRSGERSGKRGEDAEVSVERDPLKRSHSERLQPALVLQSTERPLDRGATPVQVAPSLRLAGLERFARPS